MLRARKKNFISWLKILHFLLFFMLFSLYFLNTILIINLLNNLTRVIESKGTQTMYSKKR